MFSIRSRILARAAAFLTLVAVAVPVGSADGADQVNGAPPVPVRVAAVEERMVTEQVSLIGTTESVRESSVASEVSGRVDVLDVKAGDFVKSGSRLAGLSKTDLSLRLKGAVASREAIKAKLAFAQKELARITTLKDTNSVAAKQYDETFFNHSMLMQEIVRSDAEIERLEYELTKKEVLAPFTGFIAEEFTQVGEWVNVGGGIVRLVDLSHVLIRVDVPEAYVVRLAPDSKVEVVIKSVSPQSMAAEVAAILPVGNAAARTFPVHIRLPNAGLKIKSGMEAVVSFDLGRVKKALLVPKDAVVAAGSQRLVYVVNSDKALPVPITVVGYYGNDAAVEGGLSQGQRVVIRGNERLRPGQTIQVIEE